MLQTISTSYLGINVKKSDCTTLTAVTINNTYKLKSNLEKSMHLFFQE